MHDSITGVKGSFEKSLGTLKLFKKLDVAINVESVLMNSNCNDYDGLFALANEIGASFQSSSYIIPHNNMADPIMGL